MNSAKFFVFALLIFTASVSCRDKATNTEYNIDTGLNAKPPIVLKEKAAFNDTARFLGGLESEKYGKDEYYAEYCRTVEKIWNEFFGTNLQSIREWSSANLRSGEAKAVFYPFSGPDVLHPLSLYPNAREILMFGLEPTGGVPDISNANKERLRELLEAVRFTMEHAFFVTSDMEKNVRPVDTNGISAIMLFFLARGGFETLQAKETDFFDNSAASAQSSQHQKQSEQKRNRGIEILFVKAGERNVRRIRYFQMDAGNGSKSLAEFQSFMEDFPPPATVIKSASYLMRWNTFSQIKNLILNKSVSILQDDSGIPYETLKRDGRFRLTHFGKYHRPIPVFADRYQPDLQADNKAFSKVALPFVYGYGYGYEDMTYHLVLAEKKPSEKAPKDAR